MHYSGAVYRPPSEARSLIVQCTLGCSHNKCAFCTMYKDKKFSINPIEQVLSDLDEARAYGRYIEKIFLADGDALILPMDYLLTVLDYIRDHFPTCKRVAAYATTKAIMRKTDDELRTLREHGLGIVYIGLESGRGKFVYKIRHHIKDFRDSILILDVYQFCCPVLDHKNCTRHDLSTHTTGTVIFLFL